MVRTSVFGAEYEGSNPSTPAIEQNGPSLGAARLRAYALVRESHSLSAQVSVCLARSAQSRHDDAARLGELGVGALVRDSHVTFTKVTVFSGPKP